MSSKYQNVSNAQSREVRVLVLPHKSYAQRLGTTNMSNLTASADPVKLAVASVPIAALYIYVCAVCTVERCSRLGGNTHFYIHILIFLRRVSRNIIPIAILGLNVSPK